MNKGLLILISGPSGVGKGTIVDMLRKRFTGAVFVPSLTTREKRPGEKDGEQYFFVTEAEFKKKVEAGEFLEWATVHQKASYGILKKPVEEALAAGKVIIREVDVQGFESICKHIPASERLSIFIKPENVGLLLHRIEHRGALSPEELALRMESVKREMTDAGKYDYQITNSEGQVLKCFMEVEGIILSRVEQKGLVLAGKGGISI